MAWKIFKHAISMLLRNWQDVLRIIALPMALGVALLLAVFGNLAVGHDLMDGAVRGPGMAMPLLTSLAIAGLSLWAAVNWHRFVLLEEYQQGWVPPLRVDRILSYFGHALILAVLLLLGAVPGIVINVIVGMTSSFLGVIVGIALFVVMVVASYRLSVIMPAAAIGRSLPVRRAWEATKGTTLTIGGLVLLSFALSFLLQVLIAILSFVLPVVGGLISVVVSCFTSLLGLSIMTTMYGVYIEGRSLD